MQQIRWPTCFGAEGEAMLTLMPGAGLEEKDGLWVVGCGWGVLLVWQGQGQGPR